MPSSNFSAWYLQKNGVNYVTAPDNNQIQYRTNNWNIANLVFNIADPNEAVRGQLLAEDEVSVWIGNPSSGGVKMMDGFIDYKYPTRLADGSTLLYVTVFDYIGYLAAKAVFQQRYWQLANATAKQIFTDAGNSIPGIAGINADSNLTNLVQQTFQGTYAKDGFTAAAQAGYADYFGDENKILQAFTHGGRDLLASNSQRYKLVDNAPTSANVIKVNTMFDHYFKYDVTNRFKTVITTSGIQYTYPNDIDLWQKSGEVTTLGGKYGVSLSTHYTPLNPIGDYDTNNFPNAPIPFNYTNLSIGAINYPVLILNVATPADPISMLIGNIDQNTALFVDEAIPLDGTWLEISFFMRIDLLTPVLPYNVQLLLFDAVNGGNYSRYLKQGSTTLFITGGMTFIRFSLPSPLSANGWTLSGTCSEIDHFEIIFTNSGGNPQSGFNAGSSVLISQFYLYKTVTQQSANIGGTPQTAQIIMNRSITDQTSLLALADAQFNRVSPMPYEVKCTFYGNSDFRKPGYAVDVDFTGNLEPDSKNGAGTVLNFPLRIDQIVHYLDKSRWNTEVTLKPAYQVGN